MQSRRKRAQSFILAESNVRRSKRIQKRNSDACYLKENIDSEDLERAYRTKSRKKLKAAKTVPKQKRVTQTEELLLSIISSLNSISTTTCNEKEQSKIEDISPTKTNGAAAAMEDLLNFIHEDNEEDDNTMESSTSQTESFSIEIENLNEQSLLTESTNAIRSMMVQAALDCAAEYEHSKSRIITRNQKKSGDSYNKTEQIITLMAQAALEGARLEAKKQSQPNNTRLINSLIVQAALDGADELLEKNRTSTFSTSVNDETEAIRAIMVSAALERAHRFLVSEGESTADSQTALENTALINEILLNAVVEGANTITDSNKNQSSSSICADDNTALLQAMMVQAIVESAQLLQDADDEQISEANNTADITSSMESTVDLSEAILAASKTPSAQATCYPSNSMDSTLEISNAVLQATCIHSNPNTPTEHTLSCNKLETEAASNKTESTTNFSAVVLQACVAQVVEEQKDYNEENTTDFEHTQRQSTYQLKAINSPAQEREETAEFSLAVLQACEENVIVNRDEEAINNANCAEDLRSSSDSIIMENEVSVEFSNAVLQACGTNIMEQSAEIQLDDNQISPLLDEHKAEDSLSSVDCASVCIDNTEEISNAVVRALQFPPSMDNSINMSIIEENEDFATQIVSSTPESPSNCDSMNDQMTLLASDVADLQITDPTTPILVNDRSRNSTTSKPKKINNTSKNKYKRKKRKNKARKAKVSNPSTKEAETAIQADSNNNVDQSSFNDIPTIGELISKLRQVNSSARRKEILQDIMKFFNKVDDFELLVEEETPPRKKKSFFPRFQPATAMPSQPSTNLNNETDMQQLFPNFGKMLSPVSRLSSVSGISGIDSNSFLDGGDDANDSLSGANLIKEALANNEQKSSFSHAQRKRLSSLQLNEESLRIVMATICDDDDNSDGNSNWNWV